MKREIKTRRMKRIQVPTAVLDIAVLPEERSALLATFAGVGEVDLESGEYTGLYSHQSYVSGVAYLPELNQVVSSGYDGKLCWVDRESKVQVRTVDAARAWIWKLASGQRNDGTRLIAAGSGQYLAGDYEYRPKPSEEPNVQVWDAATGEVLHRFTMLPPVQAVALSSCGTRVAAANLMGDVAVWQLDPNRAAAPEELAGERAPDWAWQTPDFTAFGVIKSHCQVGGIYAVSFTPDSDFVVVAGMGPMVDPMAGNGRQRWQKFSLKPGEQESRWQSKDDGLGEGLMEALLMAPELGCFAMSGRLRGGAFNTGLFDLESGDLLHGFKSDSRVTAMRILGDGSKWILAGALNQSQDPNHKFGVVDVFRYRVKEDSEANEGDEIG